MRASSGESVSHLAIVWRLADGTEKGKDVTPGILRSAEQYGVRDKFIDTPCFDVTQGPWRRGGWLDAIVTDPPCK